MRSSTKVFLLLVSLTLLAFLISFIDNNIEWFMAILFISTLLKGKLIADYFMGMKSYYRWSNFITIWLLIVLLSVVGIYLLTS